MNAREFSIAFARSARKEIEALDAEMARRVHTTIISLVTEPYPRGCRKLLGGRRRWRIRVGDYRIIYDVFEGERIVDVIAIRHRSEAYR